MKKIFSFLAGGMCGVLIGGVTTLLLTPASGRELVTRAENRWNYAKSEARRARLETQQDLERQYENATNSRLY